MARNYIIKFYNGSGALKSDWPYHQIEIFCTYEQAVRKAEDYKKTHPNVYAYRILEK